jgi:hypothetical protein
MLKVASNFDKNLFAKEDRMDISLDANFWDSQDLLTTKEVALLDIPLHEEDIYKNVMYSFRRCLWVRGFFVSHFSRNLWNAI